MIHISAPLLQCLKLCPRLAIPWRWLETPGVQRGRNAASSEQNSLHLSASPFAGCCSVGKNLGGLYVQSAQNVARFTFTPCQGPEQGKASGKAGGHNQGKKGNRFLLISLCHACTWERSQFTQFLVFCQHRLSSDLFTSLESYGGVCTPGEFKRQPLLVVWPRNLVTVFCWKPCRVRLDTQTPAVGFGVPGLPANGESCPERRNSKWSPPTSQSSAPTEPSSEDPINSRRLLLLYHLTLLSQPQ